MTRAIVLAGPTGVGKSRIAVEVAERLNGEIISADSRQGYRHLRIGTARPSRGEMSRVPHHLTGFLDPREAYSAGRFARDASEIVEAIDRRGRLPVICGGTGFYIKALLEGLFDEGSAIEERENVERTRRSLEAELERAGPSELHKRLRDLDPESAARIHPHDSQRIIRALEVFEVSGIPLSRHQKGAPPRIPVIEAYKICISLPRPILYEVINRRVEEMFEEGLVEEVAELLGKGYGRETPAFESLGYTDVVRYLSGEIGREAAIDGMRRKTRQYAKRQLTWFRHEGGYHWITAGEESVGRIVAGWGEYIRQKGERE